MREIGLHPLEDGMQPMPFYPFYPLYKIIPWIFYPYLIPIPPSIPHRRISLSLSLFGSLLLASTLTLAFELIFEARMVKHERETKGPAIQIFDKMCASEFF